MAEQVRAVCFPRGDSEFVARVHSLISPHAGEEPVMAAVEALLRESYPLARVSPRHPLAALDGGRVWYVFRDGIVVAEHIPGAP